MLILLKTSHIIIRRVILLMLRLSDLQKELVDIGTYATKRLMK